MSLNPMSDLRQDELIKCAEATIGLMNVGVEPNAALLKVARDKQLNENEVLLVSHAVNNSKAVSQLVNAEKPEDKEKPFLLTNAELVNANLYAGDKTVKADKAESKKEAAAASNIDHGYYLDVEDDRPSAEDLAAFFGVAAPRLAAKVASVAVADDLTVSIEPGLFAHSKLAAVKRSAAEASEAATAAIDGAQVALGKIAAAMRSPAGPRWGDVEKVARALGAGEDALTDIFEVAKLASFGHTRNPVKVAGVLTTTQPIHDVASLTLQVESLLKRAADCTDVAAHLNAEHDRLSAQLDKLAEDEGAQHAVEHVSTEMAELPDKLTGAAFHGENNRVVDLLGSAADTTGEAPDFSKQPPLGAAPRQEEANIASRSNIEKMMGDEFIGAHPVQDVVAAYNRALSTNPNLGEAALHALIKQDLASGGHVPLDTLVRTAKGPDPKAHA